jgi:hypothetical protein
MRVARSSRLMAATRSVTAVGFEARCSEPRASRSSREMIQSPSVRVLANVTTLTTSGSSERISSSFLTCSSSSAKTTRLAESVRMYFSSSTVVVG